ncbi:hypothetical protein BGW38_010837 [Lunasporangiospora selenospora]|uniref:Uncharacterized protein n=1 Tax=Lunasporangiospora selenospora TaxID=979761 RepID=A0A9P6KFG3_9FUNG|nr:hypothetical protein BGW38_010837 [Lunasporangiospora selenospora]
MPHWRNALSTRAKICPVNASLVSLYLVGLQDPTKLQQLDLFRAAQPKPEHQLAMERWWADSLTWLTRHRDTAIYNIGVCLRKQTKGNEDSGQTMAFWKDIEHDNAVKAAVANDNLASLRVLADIKTGALALKMSVKDAEDLTPSHKIVSRTVSLPIEQKMKKKDREHCYQSESNEDALGETGDTGDQQEHEENSDVDELTKEAPASFPHAFSSVFQALYNIAHGLPVTEIGEPEPPIECNLQQALFTHCAKSIPSFKELDSVQQKEVYVAASSIGYLPSSSAREIFGYDVVVLMEKELLDPKLNTPLNHISSFLKDLKRKTVRKNHTIDASRLLTVIRIKIGEIARQEFENKTFNSDEKTILELLEIVVPLCVPDRIPRPRGTEQMGQVVWARLLGVLFADSQISVVIGETGLEPSKSERQKNEAAHAVSVSSNPLSPRKVDIKLTVSLEKRGQWTFPPISTFEVKPKHACAKQVKLQGLKNARLNHVVMKQHSLEHLLYLDIHGMTADLMTLCQVGNVHVCSKAVDRPLQLPLSESELSWFLDGHTIQALLSLRDQMLETAVEIQTAHAQPQLYNFDRALTDSDTSLKSSPSRNYTFFTPKRSRSECVAEDSSKMNRDSYKKSRKKMGSRTEKLQ